MKDPSGNIVSLTDAIFMEKEYFKTKEDTADDDKMHEFVKQDWSSNAIIKKPKDDEPEDIPRGPAGNIVPFFPTNWSKNSNFMFNSSLFMDKHYPEEIDEYDEVKHAAIYRMQLAPGLAQKGEDEQPQEHVSGARPTSGKHYARMHSGIRRKAYGG